MHFKNIVVTLRVTASYRAKPCFETVSLIYLNTEIQHIEEQSVFRVLFLFYFCMFGNLFKATSKILRFKNLEVAFSIILKGYRNSL